MVRQQIENVFEGSCRDVRPPELSVCHHGVPDVLYVYNRANPQSHDKRRGSVRPLVSPLQARTSAILRRRPAKPLVIDNEFLHTHLYELLHAAMLSDRIARRQEIAAEIASALKRRYALIEPYAARRLERPTWAGDPPPLRPPWPLRLGRRVRGA